MVDSHTALAASIMATLLFVVLMVGVGVSRGWNCDDEGRFMFRTVNDNARFWAEPGKEGTSLSGSINTSITSIDVSLPGRNFASAESNWYYWKLRPSSTQYCEVSTGNNTGKGTFPRLYCGVSQATVGTRIIVWALYVAHQVSVWGKFNREIESLRTRA